MTVRRILNHILLQNILLQNIVIAKVCILFSAHSYALAVAGKDDFVMKFNGRVFLDAAQYSNTHDTEFANDVNWRAIRIGAKGHYHQMDYQAELNYADDKFIVRNLTLSFEPAPHWQVKLGQFKPYVSLEELTSSRYVNFLERGLHNAFMPSRRIGVGVHHFDAVSANLDYTVSLGGFGGRIGNGSINGGKHSKNTNFRSTLIHTLSKNCYSLLGMSFSYTDVDSKGELEYDSRPESNVTDIKLVETDTILLSKSALLYNIESALQLGPLSVQGEYTYNKVRRNDSHSSLSFNGFYLFTSYFITPDQRVLDKTSAQYKRVRPNCKWGAVELAARFSYIDLDNKEIRGGHERNITVGMNWYLNHNFRFMANIIKANANKEGIKTAPMIYTLRGQFDFG